MVNNVRLVQIVVVLVSILALLRVSSSRESFQTKAQNVVVSPTFNCLGPCPSSSSSSSSNGSTSPSSSVSTQPVTGTSPSVSQPCQAPLQKAMHRKGGRERGGFLGDIFQFFEQLISLLLQLLGSGSSSGISGLSSNAGSSSAPSSSSSPSTPCPPMTSPTPDSSSSSTDPSSANPATEQKLGVCGIATPAAGPNVVLSSTDSTTELTISSGGTQGNPKIYDGTCHTIGTITIKADYVTVQNFKIQATGQYGINSDGTGITIQNNDIKGIHASGDGDLNAITFFGNDIKILYNTAIDFVTGSPGGSHTDGIQTWVSSSHPVASTNVVIQGNKFTGPANPSRDNNTPSIHQCIMAEGLNAGGNSGGNGNPSNWLIADNYFSDSWNQCIKLDGIENVSITRNEFAGSSDKVMDVSPASTGTKYYSDNKVTGQYKNGVGTTSTQGSGPTKL